MSGAQDGPRHRKRSDQSLPRRVISRMPTEISPRHKAIAVVLNLMNPVRPGRRAIGGQAR